MSEPAACASLPSSESATRLLAGDVTVLPLFVRDFVGRAAIVATGLWLAGDHEPRTLARHAIGGSLAIEAWVLGYRAWEMPPQQPGVPSQPKACASIPSAELATRLLNGGDAKTFLILARDFLFRMGIVGTGLWIAGDREPSELLRHTVGGSLAVAMFGLWYRAMAMPGEVLVPPTWDPSAGVRELPAPQPAITRLVPVPVPFVDGAPAYSPVHRVVAA